MALVYVCENDLCIRFEKRVGVERDAGSECAVCGWFMSSVPGASIGPDDDLAEDSK